MTNENGAEFGKYEDLENEFGAPVYYGHDENMNGLNRHFFPKQTNFNEVSDEDIQGMENTLNLRPRKMFNFHTPDEIYSSKFTRLIKGTSSPYRDMNQRLDSEFRRSLINAGVELESAKKYLGRCYFALLKRKLNLQHQVV